MNRPKLDDTVEWIELAQHRIYWWAVVFTVMEPGRLFDYQNGYQDVLCHTS
jgi:hypothetical protein